MVSKGDVREALTTIEGINWTESAIKSVRAIDDGVNDTFLITIASNKEFDSTQIPDKDRLFIKFATFSRPESLTAGIAAYRLLSRYTNLPVPSVYAVSFEATELPAFYVAEYLPGDLLEDPTDPHNPIAARKLGQVIADLGSIPSASTNGYGMIKEWQSSKPPAVCAPYDDFATWLVEYAEMLYNDLPEHHKLEQVASDVPAFIRANMEQLPSNPDPSVVLTDFGTSNLLVIDRSSAREENFTNDDPQLTGVVDLERAKIGPSKFTAVNAEYLMTRGVDDPDLLVNALYDPLSFEPDVPARDLYRLVATGRSVNALDVWYEPGSEQYDRRGKVIASAIDQIIY